MSNIAADRLPAIRNVLADFRAAATDKAARRERDIREASAAIAAAGSFNPTADMVPVVAAIAACDDTASLIRVAGALLQAITEKEWSHDNAHMMWAGMQDVISDLSGLYDNEAEAAWQRHMMRGME